MRADVLLWFLALAQDAVFRVAHGTAHYFNPRLSSLIICPIPRSSSECINRSSPSATYVGPVREPTSCPSSSLSSHQRVQYEFPTLIGLGTHDQPGSWPRGSLRGVRTVLLDSIVVLYYQGIRSSSSMHWLLCYYTRL